MEQGSCGDSMYPAAFVSTAPFLDLQAAFVTLKHKLLHAFHTFTKTHYSNKIYKVYTILDVTDILINLLQTIKHVA